MRSDVAQRYYDIKVALRQQFDIYLTNSQFRDISANGTRLTGRVGYSANYAIYVHDPNVKQVFRRPMAEKEFLTKGFADAKQSIEKAIMEEMKL
ncbi:TPA: hypothetical protein RJI64_000721 [Yersinia enterocolitica]|nr:hypothetical protein [Yersinia enterocolitica]HDV5951159.1 hypothetical protein [Yersinia enterocolitica]HDV7149495.1 hypothetical protein [Yersinia enterocolitica]HED5568854.1 hypothetical protein [Yersinia enterocolitica]